MKDIAIFGAGGFGKEVACLINRINEDCQKWNLIGFFDDNIEVGSIVSHFGSILGGIEELNKWDKALSIVIAIGNPNAIRSISHKITNPLVSFPNLIHPDFFKSDPQTFSIGKGNIIQGSCVVTCDVSIGNFNTFNGYVVVGHDVTIGSYNTFMPAVRVSGEVTIGDCNFFGVSSIILQRIRIGNNIKLGAGSVLMTKPHNDTLYIGNPAKKFRY